MKKILFLPIALGCVMLTSCTEEDYGFESHNIAFEKTMSQMLGQVDPDQTWINAEQGCVTLSEACEDVKVFDGLTGKVVASYHNLRAGDKVYYNATVGYGPTISNGAVALQVKNGETVSFKAAGRAVSPQIEVGEKRITVKNNLIEKDLFRNGAITDLSTNFEFVAPGNADMITFDVYPLYWNTNDQLTVGLYYYDPTTKEVVDCPVPVYQNRQANLESGIMQSFAAGKTFSVNAPESYWENAGDYNDSRTVYSAYGSPTTSQAHRVKPISITVPANLVFGFYVQSNDGPKYYANPALNTSCTEDDACHGGVHADSYTATSTYQTNTFGYGDKNVFYLALGADHDDLKESETKIDGKIRDTRNIYLAITNVRTIKYETQSYTMCFEDLGATTWQDMDFNDCVLKLTCANGDETAGLSLLAAGGRLPIKVTYDGRPVWNEIHEALGQDLVPVNANQHSTGKTEDVVSAEAIATTITLPETWTIQSLVAKFGLEVTMADGATRTQVSIPETKGDYPKGFAVAGDFQWPGEQQNILGEYPDFATWAASANISYWYPWSAE